MARWPNANGIVSAIALQADGKILVGGSFTLMGAEQRNLFARLNNDTAASQSLTVSQNAVTWTRGGSGPQFERVSFEASTNNVNYTLLGSGTSVASNWTLTGLNLPPSQNLYIRARGYSGRGSKNGSGSITESVQNVFLTATPHLNIRRTSNVVLS